MFTVNFSRNVSLVIQNPNKIVFLMENGVRTRLSVKKAIALLSQKEGEVQKVLARLEREYRKTCSAPQKTKGECESARRFLTDNPICGEGGL
jgi:orotate phosphoribosyltransferase